MRDKLCWDDIPLFGDLLPADSVSPGDNVRIVMNTRFQFAFLSLMFPDMGTHQGALSELIWLERGGERHPAGSPEFCSHVGSMIRQRGLLANLSIRENLLLPFLYDSDENALKDAQERIEEVAAFLGLEGLDTQAGSRSSYTHALVSLGHCLLKKPDIIVAQEVHVGMSPERLAQFADRAKAAVKSLEAGVLYLTSTEHEGSGIFFARSYSISSDAVPDVSGIW